MEFNGFTYEISKHFSDTYGWENMFTDQLDNLKGETFILFKFYLLENYPTFKSISLDNDFNKFCLSFLKISLKEFIPYSWSSKKTFLALFYMYDFLKINTNFYFDFNNYRNQKYIKGEEYDKNFSSLDGYLINHIGYYEIYSIKDEDFYNNIYITSLINIEITELLENYLDLYREGYFILKYDLKDPRSVNNLFLNDVGNIIKNTGTSELDSSKDLHFLNNSELYWLNLIDLIKNNIFELKLKNNYEDYSNWDDKISYIKNNYNQLFEDLVEKNKNKKQSQEIKYINSLDELFDYMDIIREKLHDIGRKYKLRDETLGLFEKYAKIISKYFDMDISIEEISFLIEHMTQINDKLDFLLIPLEEITEKIRDNIYINDEINNRLFDNNYHTVTLIKKGGNIRELEGGIKFSGEQKLVKLAQKYKFSDVLSRIHDGKIQRYEVTEKVNFKKEKESK